MSVPGREVLWADESNGGEEEGLGLEYGAHGKRVRRVSRARLSEHPNVQDGSREFKLT